MQRIIIKATVKLENSLWIAFFERMDKKGIAVARYVFGSEPTDPELYDFISENYFALKFTTPQNFELIIKRQNPKRMQRQVKKEVAKAQKNLARSSYAQDILRVEIEKNKKIKKAVSKREKIEKTNEKFTLKQLKKKKKARGH